MKIKWQIFGSSLSKGFRDLLSSNEINVSSSNSKRRELKLGGGKKEGIRALNTCWHKLAFVGKLRPNIIVIQGKTFSRESPKIR